MRAALAVALLLLPALAAAAPKKGSEVMPQLPWEQLDGIVAQFEKGKSRMEPLLAQLRTLQAEYPKPADPEDLAGRRANLRARIQRLSEELNLVGDHFRESQKAIQLQAVPLAFASVDASNFQEASGKEMMKALTYDETHKSMAVYLRGIRDQLNGDHAAYELYENGRKDRRRVTLIASSAGAAAVVIFVLFVWGWRQKVVATQALTGAVTGAAQGQPTTSPSPIIYLSSPASAPPSPAALSGPVGAAALPEVLGGNFKIVRELGQGGMGVVYEALDLTLQRPVAIKRLRPELTQSKRELEMFLAEARLVASLKHPHLVEILSILREGEQLFLVFEFVSGKPLHAILDEGEPLPHERIKPIVDQVARALDYAHSKRIIHRDLKPSNIMLTEDGSVKVMDFGIAHQAKKTVAKVTRADAWGTPPYMAPEQELGTVSRESDIYSLGVCYYEMLTGQLPFQGPNFLAQKREMAYAKPTTTGPRPHPSTDEIVAKALQADPQLRFHSAAEFAAAVAAVPA